MVPVLVLAIIGAALIKSLMSVVGRDEVGGQASPTTDFAPAQAYDPTVELRASVNDDVRAFLLPAVAEPAPFEPVSFEHASFEHASFEHASFEHALFEQAGGTVTGADGS